MVLPMITTALQETGSSKGTFRTPHVIIVHNESCVGFRRIYTMVEFVFRSEKRLALFLRIVNMN